jgi:hypothetical protein
MEISLNKDRGDFISPNINIVELPDFAQVASKFCFGSTMVQMAILATDSVVERIAELL